MLSQGSLVWPGISNRHQAFADYGCGGRSLFTDPCDIVVCLIFSSVDISWIIVFVVSAFATELIHISLICHSIQILPKTGRQSLVWTVGSHASFRNFPMPYEYLKLFHLEGAGTSTCASNLYSLWLCSGYLGNKAEFNIRKQCSCRQLDYDTSRSFHDSGGSIFPIKRFASHCQVFHVNEVCWLVNIEPPNTK